MRFGDKPKENRLAKLLIYKSLFKGRIDVFAKRWEKGKKAGYIPAYDYDRNKYWEHKRNGGTFKEFDEKTHTTLNDQQLLKHLQGEQFIGIYPLLQNNTSWFIAADFDKENWAEECRSLINACKEKGIPAYLERSRSGKGGHAWIFFDTAYPAIKSRRILITLLEQAGLFSIFDKTSSFDRLFPNQDYHSGKGLGNLIALPLNRQTLEQGNCCFVDEQLDAYPDQWQFLSFIRRVSVSHLDAIYDSIQSGTTVATLKDDPGKLIIKLNNSVQLNRSGMSPELISFLKKELNFSNSEYFIKRKTGRSTWGTEKYFRFIEETETEIVVPRGFVGKIVRFCKQQKIDFVFMDEREKQVPVSFLINLSLRAHQNSAVEAASNKDFGVITAPPGSGKTVIGIKIIADKQLPALIIVHRKQLLEQWVERIQAFLRIPNNEIGKIGQGRAKPGKEITVAMIQSLSKYIEKEENDEFVKSFGTIIIDECHHIPAETYQTTVSKLFPYYQYGLTATPFRKENDGKIIFAHLGELIADIKPQEIEEYKRARIIVRETSLDVPFNQKTDPFETLSKVLVHDSARNKLIVGDIALELNKGRKAIIITERKEHIDTLYQFLKQSFEIITLSGEDSESSRKTKWKLLNSGNYQGLITTGQFFGEGTDLQNASCLFLVYPFTFKGKLIQYIGRVQRSEFTPIIYDYRDRNIEYLDRQFLKRNRYYRNFDRQATLFDDVIDTPSITAKTSTIDKRIKVSIDQLDFRYGAIAFKYIIPESKIELDFEVENNEVRPEFDVLKPYFTRQLKTKHIVAEIFAEFENGILVSQSAHSSDLENINQKIIESVKVRFLEQNFINRQYTSERGNLLDLQQVQEGIGGMPYGTEEVLLEDLLKNKDVKHYKHLRYLASKHDGAILKLRFVLNPFSFVFLLSGREQYHIVLETLDTEEATYIWHIEKNRQMLMHELQRINQDLNIIRNRGRQAFLEKQPENFSRLIHDYSDERKGFILWKDRLEERLI
jgi:superfamily II DNA or RNA helicase